MTKVITRNTAQVSGIWLKPEYCATEEAVFEAAFNGVRRRPVMARTDKGELVVCCSRTAKKKGWVIEGRLFGKVAEESAATPAPAPAKPAAKAQPKTAAKRAKRLASLEEMLG